MKRKTYFLISGIIQIIFSIYAFFTTDKIVSELVNSTSIYPEEMQEQLNSIFQSIGPTYVVILAIVGLILNILIVYFAFRNKLIEKKTTILVCSIMCLIFSLFMAVELLAIINIIVIASAKGNKDENTHKEKKEMPVLEKEKVDKKKIFISVILFIVYFSQIPLGNILPENAKTNLIVSILFYLVMAILVIILFYDLLSEHFKVFRKNFKTYLSNLGTTIGIFYLVYFVVSAIIIFGFHLGTSANQKSVTSLPVFILIPLSIIYAPLVEETLFRGCLRRFIKNDKLFIIISGICFGLIHTAFSEPNLYRMIMLGIPYMIMGGFLAHFYVKTNNICTNMAFHAFHNTIAVIISILIKLA